MQVEMQAQANPDGNVKRARGTSRENRSRDRVPVAIEDRADDRLWLARSGRPGIYRVDPASNETVFFLVQVRVNTEPGDRQGERYTQVFFLSDWIGGECDESVDPPARGERRPFLSFSILLGKFDPNRLPPHLSNEEREDLIYDAERICAGVRRYDEMHPRRPSRRRDH